MSLVTVVPSGARTSAGTQDFNGWTPVLPLRVEVDVTAVSGTSPSMTVYLEQSLDGVNWTAVTQVTATAAAPAYLVATAGLNGTVSSLLRFRWDITGTNPSFTFSTIVHAVP
jgi:hypothetical protein